MVAEVEGIAFADATSNDAATAALAHLDRVASLRNGSGMSIDSAERVLEWELRARALERLGDRVV